MDLDRHKRQIVMRFRVTAEEREMIEGKMRQCRITSFNAYARKMLIDGYVLQVDYSFMQSVAAELHRIGVNLNQVVKRIQSTGHVYDQDVAEMKEMMEKSWQLLRSSLLSLPKARP